MATVTINTGPVSPLDLPRDVPIEKWPDLIAERRMFIGINAAKDCRFLLEWVKQASELWEGAGYKNAEDLVRDGYGLDPTEVDLALKWLEIRKPEDAVPYRTAITLGRISMLENVQRAAEQPGTVNPNGTNQYSGFDNYQTPSDEGGTSADYLTARIARDRPDILERMKAGQYRSVRQAAIDAGIVNPKQRYSLPGEPEAAGRYLATRVDREWFETMMDAYHQHIPQ